jgi:hypothetical protein
VRTYCGKDRQAEITVEDGTITIKGWYSVVSSFGKPVGGIFHRLSFLDKRGYHRVLLVTLYQSYG